MAKKEYPIQLRYIKSHTKIIDYTGYITAKNLSYVKINSVNTVCFITDKTNAYIEENIGNKYLTLVSTGKNKDTSRKYAELWD